MGNIPCREGIFEISKHDSKPNLIGSKCNKCGIYLFPSKKICPACFDDAMTEVALNRTGKVYSYTIIRQAPTGFNVPFATAYIDLPEGVRVFAQLDLACWEKGEPRIGQEVELALGPVRTDAQGNQIIGIKFIPV